MKVQALIIKTPLIIIVLFISDHLTRAIAQPAECISDIHKIEINNMETECLGKKITNEEVLKHRLQPWVAQRNKERKPTIGRFQNRDADQKLTNIMVFN